MDINSFNLIHLAYYLMQVELMGLCYFISSTNNKNNAGLGLGIGLLMYILNIMANISDKLEMVKYISPFGYCEASDIFVNGSLDFSKILIALIIFSLSLAAGYFIYNKKDIK